MRAKCDTDFTQPGYDAAFLNKSGDDRGQARPKTAAELLRGEDDEDRSRRRRKRPE